MKKDFDSSPRVGHFFDKNWLYYLKNIPTVSVTLNRFPFFNNFCHGCGKCSINSRRFWKYMLYVSFHWQNPLPLSQISILESSKDSWWHWYSKNIFIRLSFGSLHDRISRILRLHLISLWHLTIPEGKIRHSSACRKKLLKKTKKWLTDTVHSTVYFILYKLSCIVSTEMVLCISGKMNTTIAQI